MDFYVIVSLIAIILLIAILVFFGYLVNKSKAVNYEFPKYKQPCPDFWSYNDDGKCTVNPSNPFTTPKANTTPSDVLTNGGTDNATVDFGNKDKWATVFPSISSDCKFTAWATENNVLWDGVTNNTKCANAIKPAIY